MARTSPRTRVVAAIVAGGTAALLIATTGAHVHAAATPQSSIDGLAFSTYLGDHEPDSVREIAVDGAGNVYVLSLTESKSFPTTPGAFDRGFNGGSDVAVSKLDPTGRDLIWSTFLGGSGFECSPQCGMAVDASGAAYVVGSASSSDFPTTAGAFDTTLAGRDGFLAKLRPDGGALVYSTLLGGGASEIASGVAVDETGAAYVTGSTRSPEFPTTLGAFDRAFDGTTDAFVTKVNPAGDSLAYSTLLGGDDTSQGGETGFGIRVGSTGSAYVVGITDTADFPVTIGSVDPTHNGGNDAFVTRLDPQGGALVYSSYLGGADLDFAVSLDLDDSGAATVVGSTRSADFPTTPGALDTTHGSPGVTAADGYAVRLDSSGSALVYGTFLGGAGFDGANGVAVDTDGTATVTGGTSSADFPLTSDAVDSTLVVSEAFVTRLDTATGGGESSTFLGGSRNDSGEAVALGPDGAARVGGSTISPDFPTTRDAYAPRFSGKSGGDGFVARFGML